MTEERIQKLMAQAGIASRRDAEEYITAGRVTVNGEVANLGDRADLDKDDVRVDNAPIRAKTAFTYVMINKPHGVVTTVEKQYQDERDTVRDLIPIQGRFISGRAAGCGQHWPRPDDRRRRSRAEIDSSAL